MKRILFVIPYLVEGGAERALSNITTYFPPNWDIDILVNDDREVAYLFKGNIITLGITGEPRTSSVIFQFKVFLKRVRVLKHLKKTGNYRACVSFLDSANIANILSGNKYCKAIASVRISLMQSAKKPQYRYIVNPLVKMLYGRADKVVAVSEGVREELITDFGLQKRKVVTIENGYNLLDIRRQAQEELSDKEKKIFDDKRIIVTTGRLSEQKGQWHLIRTFTQVVKQIPNAILIIIGSGELEEYLKHVSRTCKMDKNIYFTGHVSNPYKYLRYADVFVLSSLFEGFPNALAEAVCLGLPCIATDFHTGAREILAPELITQNGIIEYVTEVSYGMLTPVCSGKYYKDISEPLELAEQCLAQAMIKMLTDEEKRNEYKQKSMKRREDLKIDAVINKWVEMIEND